MVHSFPRGMNFFVDIISQRWKLLFRILFFLLKITHMKQFWCNYTFYLNILFQALASSYSLSWFFIWGERNRMRQLPLNTFWASSLCSSINEWRDEEWGSPHLNFFAVSLWTWNCSFSGFGDEIGREKRIIFKVNWKSCNWRFSVSSRNYHENWGYRGIFKCSKRWWTITSSSFVSIAPFYLAFPIVSSYKGM